jgi:hypothetical protein
MGITLLWGCCTSIFITFCSSGTIGSRVGVSEKFDMNPSSPLFSRLNFFKKVKFRQKFLRSGETNSPNLRFSLTLF